MYPRKQQSGIIGAPVHMPPVVGVRTGALETGGSIDIGKYLKQALNMSKPLIDAANTPEVQKEIASVATKVLAKTVSKLPASIGKPLKAITPEMVSDGTKRAAEMTRALLDKGLEPPKPAPAAPAATKSVETMQKQLLGSGLKLV